MIGIYPSHPRHMFTLRHGIKTFRPEDFGATGDGVADDTAAFQAIQAEALLNPNKLNAKVVLQPNKHYTYTDAHWFMGFRSLKVAASSSTKLECTASTPIFAIDKNVFNLQDWNNENNLADRTSVNELQGYLIDLANEGDRFVTLKTEAEASNLSPGDPCIIMGFANQDNGAPFDARFFEYVYATSVDGARVYLSQPLQNSYDPNWPELYTFSSSVEVAGPPRILPLKRTNRLFCNSLSFQNIEFIKNRNALTTSRLSVVGMMNFSAVNCDMSDLVEVTVGSVKSARFLNCNLGYVELDKLCKSVDIINCDMNSLSQGVGVDRITVEGSTITDDLSIAGRVNIIKRTTLSMQNGGGDVINPNYQNERYIEQYLVEDCPLVGDAVGIPLFSPGSIFSYGISLLSSSNDLLVLKTSIADVNFLYPGSKIADIEANYVGTVLNITNESATHMRIEMDWDGAVPSGTNTFYAKLIDKLSTAGTNSSFMSTNGSLVTYHATHESPEFSFLNTAILYGPMVPTSIMVDVRVASVNASDKLWLRKRSGTAGNLMTIDMSQTGVRYFDINGGDLIGSDTHDPSFWTYGEMQFGPRNGGLNAMVGTAEFTAQIIFNTPIG